MILDIFWAVVAASTGFLRSAPDYEASLDSQLMMGTVVRVDSTKGYWCHVQAMEPAYKGWINDLQLAPLEGSVEDYVAEPKLICTAEFSRIVDKPCDDAAVISPIVMGELVRSAGDASDSWTPVKLPDGRSGWMKSCDCRDFGEWASSREPSAGNVIAVARKFIGTTYMWGGASIKYVDCSGLVRNAFYMNGILLPRDASQQVKAGEEIPLDMECWRPGDLLFFGTPASGNRPMRIGHVAVYIGDGKIIHSSKVVRINSLLKGAPDYYDRRVLAVRRMLGHVGKENGPVDVRNCRWYFKQ